MSDLLTSVILLAVIGVVIAGQLKGMFLGARRLVVLPAVLVVIGASELHGTKGVSGADTAFIVGSAVIAVLIGLAQGAAMRLEQRKGSLWGQVPLWATWLWGALIASRVVVPVLADSHGATAAASSAAIILTLGLNRLAQAGVIAARASARGIPFAPDSRGRGRAFSGVAER